MIIKTVFLALVFLTILFYSTKGYKITTASSLRLRGGLLKSTISPNYNLHDINELDHDEGKPKRFVRDLIDHSNNRGFVDRSRFIKSLESTEDLESHRRNRRQMINRRVGRSADFSSVKRGRGRRNVGSDRFQKRMTIRPLKL